MTAGLVELLVDAAVAVFGATVVAVLIGAADQLARAAAEAADRTMRRPV